MNDQPPAEADRVGSPGRTRPDLRPLLLAVIAVVLVGAAVRALAPVLMPLTAAILVALAVMPVRDWVAARVPGKLSWLGILAAMATVLLVLAVFVGVLVIAAQQIVSQVPVGAGEVVQMIQGDEEEAGSDGEDSGSDGEDDGSSSVAEAAQAGASRTLGDEDAAGAAEGGGNGEGASDGNGGGAGFPGDSTAETLRELGQQALGAAGGVATAILNSTLSVVGGLVLVFFLTLLLLSESGDWRKKVIKALPWPDDWRLSESANVIASKMRAYLLIQAGIGFLSSMLYLGWLWFWGVGLLLVWPLLIFALNFIPTIGSIVGGTLPVAYTLLTQGVWPAVGVGLGILVIENIMGNLVQPNLQGRNVALSPLVLLVSLVFWGWAWGIAGALLAVPVTIALVVLGAHVPILRPWALMLSNRTNWAELDEATRPQ
ncbi:AI-2E family transporter [Rubellimicrobium roseum]|uniref:AI-2E family transporter n=1 Tax=Rubellimicrobium roseum TaxID=687525 RepID=A0A5C4NN53_9RHOB|nr:AI-2E family transporter [Rubellimicrobium roseum]TNC74087.1 AI-2E family transporter [Rubellimicrobium roseum]